MSTVTNSTDTTRARKSSERILWRLDRVARSLDISRRMLERLIAAGQFPQPDLRIGRMGLWRPRTVRQWVKARSSSVT